MKDRVDTGSLEHKTQKKSSNISAAFPTEPKLFGRIQVWRAVEHQLRLVLILDGAEPH